jgi:hypothetical protein
LSVEKLGKALALGVDQLVQARDTNLPPLPDTLHGDLPERVRVLSAQHGS